MLLASYSAVASHSSREPWHLAAKSYPNLKPCKNRCDRCRLLSVRCEELAVLNHPHLSLSTVAMEMEIRSEIKKQMISKYSFQLSILTRRCDRLGEYRFSCLVDKPTQYSYSGPCLKKDPTMKMWPRKLSLIISSSQITIIIIMNVKMKMMKLK